MSHVHYYQLTEAEEMQCSSAVATAAIAANKAQIPKIVVEKFKNTNTSRILDVGGGDGTFTSAILKTLSLTKLGGLSFAEKRDLLAKKYEDTLSAFSPTRVPSVHEFTAENNGLPMPMADYSNLIYSWGEQRALKQGQTRFDLVICSRILHYWQTGSIDLIRGIFDHLLHPGGILWIISPERNCQLFQERSSFLAEHGLPDILWNSFSDGLLDRLRCIFPCSQPSPVLTSERIDPFEIAPDAVDYLWRLNPSNTAAALNYSESHILLTKPSTEATVSGHGQYSDNGSGGGLRAVSRCMQVLRDCAPDVQFHRVALTTIAPDLSQLVKGKMPSPIEIDLPWIAQSYSIHSHGYYYCSAATDPLSNYFKDHPSLLFYRRFFLGASVAVNGTSGRFVQAFVKKLGLPKVSDLNNYSHHHLLTGVTQLEHAPLTQIPFADSWKALCESFSTEYIQPDRQDSASPLWLVALGVNILPDVPYVYSTEDVVSSSTAFFAVVQTAEDLAQKEPIFASAIKARILQFMAENMYVGLKMEEEALQKQAQMLEVIQRPLRRISKALEDMQSDTQEVRAILFEPEEALFASHAEIAPFFIEGTLKDFSGAKPTICHTTDQYAPDLNLKLVMAGVLCAIFGELDQLKKQPHPDLILATASHILDRASSSSATSELTDDLRWLLAYMNPALQKAVQGEKRWPLSLLFTWDVANIDMVKASKEGLKKIKQALFTPFKPETTSWPGLAFQLLLRNQCFRQALKADIEIAKSQTLEHSPVGMAPVLAFVRDLAVALSTQTTSRSQEDLRKSAVKAFQFGEIHGKMVVKLSWSVDRPTRISDDIKVDYIWRVLCRVVNSPRDWRIESASYGDVVRPFVMLANKLLGLNEQGGWRVVAPDSKEVLRLALNKSGARFSISVEEFAIAVNWFQEST